MTLSLFPTLPLLLHRFFSHPDPEPLQRVLLGKDEPSPELVPLRFRPALQHIALTKGRAAFDQRLAEIFGLTLPLPPDPTLAFHAFGDRVLLSLAVACSAQAHASLHTANHLLFLSHSPHLNPCRFPSSVSLP